MRFDPKRIPETRSRLAGLDPSAAAATLAGLLERAGCQVETTEVFGDPLAHVARVVLPGLGWTACLLATAWLGLGETGVARGWRIGLLILGWVWLVNSARLLRRPFRCFGPRPKALNVLGRRGKSSADARVVFLTTLDHPPRIFRSHGHRRGERGFIVALSLTAASSLVDWSGYSSGTRWGVLGLLVSTLVVSRAICWVYWLRPGPPGTMPTAALATLVELARAWPQRWDQRLEAGFAATGRTFDRTGLTALAKTCRELEPRKPTLLVGLWSTELGPPFTLAVNSDNAFEAVSAAAKGLRLPRAFSLFEFYVWLGNLADPELAVIFGDGPGHRDDDASATACLHAAQLATETALRWGRRGDSASPGQSPEAGESRARSSQNPG